MWHVSITKSRIRPLTENQNPCAYVTDRFLFGVELNKLFSYIMSWYVWAFEHVLGHVHSLCAVCVCVRMCVTCQCYGAHTLLQFAISRTWNSKKDDRNKNVILSSSSRSFGWRRMNARTYVRIRYFPSLSLSLYVMWSMHNFFIWFLPLTQSTL